MERITRIILIRLIRRIRLIRVLFSILRDMIFLDNNRILLI